MAYVGYRTPCCRSKWELRNNKENNEPVETRVVTKYNVTSTSSPTALRTNYEQNIFKSMEIDGVMLDELVTEYMFGTAGIHMVKYELYDETKLGNQAPVFYNSNLVECIIPNSVTSIGENAFNSCSGLVSIVIPDSVISIGSGVFANCTSLTEIVYNAQCGIPDGCFGSLTNLKTVVIGDSTPSIGNGAFNNCSGLTSCTIGSGVTSIGNNAFGGCSGLVSIICNAVTAPTIKSNTFGGVHASGTLTYPIGSDYSTWLSTNPYYLGYFNWNAPILCKLTLTDDSVVEIKTYETTTLTPAMTSAYTATCVSAEITDVCESIDSGTFRNFGSLTSVTIGSGVTTIGDGAFVNCSGLNSIIIPNSVTSIGAGAFNRCSSLTSCTIGNSVTNIGGSAFAECSALTSVVIPDSVTALSDWVLKDCTNLTSITCNAITPPTLGIETFINTNNCPIYVPSDSVNVYQSASDWSSYSNRIQAIS